MAFSKFDPIWSNLIQFDPIWSNLIKFEQVWTSLNKFDPVWSSLIQFDPVWSNLIQFDPIWSNMIYYDPIWSSVIQFDPTYHKMQFCNFLTKGLPRRTITTTTTKLCLGQREQSSQSKNDCSAAFCVQFLDFYGQKFWPEKHLMWPNI